jgi:iron complex outermembrane receptor protein
VGNLAATDKLAIRVGAQWVGEDGYVTHSVTGKNYMGRDTITLRGRVLWEPRSDFSVLLTAEYYRSTDNTALRTLRSQPPYCTVCSLRIGIPATDFYATTGDSSVEPFRTHSNSQSLELNWSPGTFDITSVTSFKTGETPSRLDLAGGTFVQFLDYASWLKGHTLGEEVTMATHLNGMFNITFGASYYDDHGSFDPNLLGAAMAPLLRATGQYPSATNVVDTKSYSAFAELYVKPIEKLTLTFGGRYSHDARDIWGAENQAFRIANGQPANQPLTFTTSASFKAFTPRVVVAYDLDQVNLYASYSEGFKAGVFQIPSFSTPPVVRPEEIKNYEIGAKYLSADHRLRLNFAAFHYQFADVQVQVNRQISGPTLENAASAKGHGAELDGNYHATDWLTIFGNVAYLRARYDAYPQASVVVPTGTTLVNGTQDLSGYRLPRAPQWSGALGFNINAPLALHTEAYLNVTARYTSDYDMNLPGGGPFNFARVDSYALTNITGGVRINAKYDIGFFVDNVTDERYYTGKFARTGVAGLFDTVGSPRRYGIRLSANF